MFKWLKTQRANAQKIAGLEEKQQSTKNKFELAEKINKMFDRRENDIEPVIERRRNKLEVKHV